MEHNRAVLAIALLLAVMAASIAVAVLFPYVDLNEHAALRGGGSAGGSALVVDGAPLADEHDAILGTEPAEEGSAVGTPVTTNEEEEEEHVADRGSATGISVIPNEEKEEKDEGGLPAPTPTQQGQGQRFAGDDGSDSGSGAAAAAAAANDQELERPHPRCQSLIRRADRDADGRLTAAEYAALMTDLATDLAAARGSAPPPPLAYDALPFRLKMIFLHFSCVCADCCAEEEVIYVGVGAEDLEAICAQTEAAVGEALDGGEWASAGGGG